MNSIRLFEKDHAAVFNTEIVDLVEQSVKLVRDGKPEMVNLLGVVLAETIFHPQGGGQPSDKGRLNGFEIIAVRKDKNAVTAPNGPIIYHFLNLQASGHLSKGQAVDLKLDTEFRGQCARSHTAGHLISDALEHDAQFRSYQAKPIQGHHFPGGEYIKVLVAIAPSNTEELCQQLNVSLDRLVKDDLLIATSDQGGVRHIKIGDSARMCGGTHVVGTRELAGFKVTKIKAKMASEGQTELTIFYGYK